MQAGNTKTLGACVFVVLGCTLVSLCGQGCATSETSFRRAQKADTIEGYTSFLERYGGSPEALQARQRREELYWKAAEAKGRSDDYERFLSTQAQRDEYRDKAKEQLARLYWPQVRTAALEDLEAFYSRFNNTSLRQQALDRIEEMLWEGVTKEQSAAAYARYLTRFPDGRYVEEARTKGEGIYWEHVEQQGRQDAYEEYIKLFPAGSHRERADLRIGEFLWEAATQAKTNAILFADYLKKCPKGPHADSAQDNVAWALAEAIATPESVASYLLSYPNGLFADPAKKVFDLIKDDAPAYVASGAIKRVKDALSQSSGIGGAAILRGWISGGSYSISYSGTISAAGEASVRITDGSSCRIGDEVYVYHSGRWQRDFKPYFTVGLASADSKE